MADIIINDFFNRLRTQVYMHSSDLKEFLLLERDEKIQPFISKFAIIVDRLGIVMGAVPKENEDVSEVTTILQYLSMSDEVREFLDVCYFH